MGVCVSTSLFNDFLWDFIYMNFPFSFFFFFRYTLEKCYIHTEFGKTSLKFQRDILFDLNPSFCWSRGGGICDLNWKKSIIWYPMSSAMTTGEGVHSKGCTWTRSTSECKPSLFHRQVSITNLTSHLPHTTLSA